MHVSVFIWRTIQEVSSILYRSTHVPISRGVVRGEGPGIDGEKRKKMCGDKEAVYGFADTPDSGLKRRRRSREKT